MVFSGNPAAKDTTVIFYVNGYLARSVVRATKCKHCREYLITTEPLDTDDKRDYSAWTFLDAVNRGGLSNPTDFAFSLECFKRSSHHLSYYNIFSVHPATRYCSVKWWTEPAALRPLAAALGNRVWLGMTWTLSSPSGFIIARLVAGKHPCVSREQACVLVQHVTVVEWVCQSWRNLLWPDL